MSYRPVQSVDGILTADPLDDPSQDIDSCGDTRKLATYTTDDEMLVKAFVAEWASSAQSGVLQKDAKPKFPKVKRVDVFIKDCQLLDKGIVLVDLPGEDDSYGLVHDLAHTVIREADLLCVVSPIDQIQSCATVIRLLESAGTDLHSNCKRNAVLVATHVDAICPYKYLKENSCKDSDILELKTMAVILHCSQSAQLQYCPYC